MENTLKGKDIDFVYLPTEYATVVEPGDPLPLFPLVSIFKNGVERTAEIISKLKLPHFLPPVKLGSHEEGTPAGAHIKGLFIRDGMVWGTPEMNDKGVKAIAEKHYKYLSPEVIWEGGLEDPLTGNVIPAPLIVGAALLHTPHLGEATALYTVEPIESHKEKFTMTQEMDMVSVSTLEKIKEFFTTSTHDPELQKPEPQQAAAPSEDYAAKLEAANKEAEKYKAEAERLQAERQQGERISYFASEFKEATAVAEDKELHTLLAGLDEEIARELVTKFKALSAQIDESNLTSDVGEQSNGEGVNQALVFDAAVRKHMTEHKVNYNAAVSAVANQQPELWQEVSNG